MEAKTFELRDAATFIPMLAVRLDPVTEQDRYLLSRAGYGKTPDLQAAYYHLIRISGGTGQSGCDPHDWGNRTMRVAHEYIIKYWDRLESGCVVDVEYILGESPQAKLSERVTASL